MYHWSNDESQNEPFQKPILTAEITAEIGGAEIKFNQPVEYRYADDVRGEVRRNLKCRSKNFFESRPKFINRSKQRKAQTRKISLSVTNNSPSPVSGEVKLNAPNEIKISSSAVNFNLKNKGEKRASYLT